MRKMFSILTQRLVSKKTAEKMSQKVAAYEELQKMQQLEREAADIVHSYQRQDRQQTQPDPQLLNHMQIRRQNAYVRMLRDTMMGMEERIRESNNVAEATSVELLAAIKSLEDLEKPEVVKHVMGSSEADRLMHENKYVSIDEIVLRIDETIVSIREMLADLGTLSQSDAHRSRDSNGNLSNGGGGDEEEQEVLKRVKPGLLNHSCPLPCDESGGGNPTNGSSDKSKSELLLQIEEQRWKVSKAASCYASDRRSEKMLKCLKRLRDAESLLHTLRAGHRQPSPLL